MRSGFNRNMVRFQSEHGQVLVGTQSSSDRITIGFQLNRGWVPIRSWSSFDQITAEFRLDRGRVSVGLRLNYIYSFGMLHSSTCTTVRSRHYGTSSPWQHRRISSPSAAVCTIAQPLNSAGIDAVRSWLNFDQNLAGIGQNYSPTHPGIATAIGRESYRIAAANGHGVGGRSHARFRPQSDHGRVRL